ncbi:aggregation-promoting factor C-terminal-like domain-containing protein [Mycolicibacterium llatzerense]|uniref:aggregation-promoting factor C-terminal-like domain-containing protein n=1 Tax=Mycolicibacterium llatzerense TaxID=280871 RepID=UPI0021B62E53|nr:hypothetical protein [Mycolicibacterium llatzerense]MCT7369465.1 hypothetical protein [Mycolicibacterium llatzerense]
MPDYSAGEAKLSIVPDLKGFKRKLEDDLRSIDAELRVQVQANTAQARADINRFREIAQRDDLKIGVVTKTTEASAELASWRARQEANHVKVKVDADTGGALKSVQELQGAVGDIFGTLGKGLKFSLSFAGIGELPAVTLALTQAVAAVQQLAGAGLVLPGLFAGAGASIGTLALGLNGVADAYDAIAKAAKPTLSEQAQNAREVTAATNAHRNAVQDEAQAERDRTQAVRDARRALEDLNLQLRGGKISEEQAVNNALRQRRDLQRDLAKGQIKDQLDLQQRLLDIEAADQSVAEAHQRNLELQEKAADANDKGIANSDKVVAANERVTRSQQAVTQTSDALAQAIGKPGAAAADAIANLSPNMQQVLKDLAGMQDRFQAFGNTVQDNISVGLSGSIKSLIDSDLPVLEKGIGGIATAWNGTLKQLFTSLGSDSTKGLLDRVLGDTAKAQDEFTKAIDPLVKGIGTLTAAGADALPRLADDLKSVAERFNTFITGADQTGALSRTINDGITGFEHLGNTILNIGSVIGAVTKAAGGGEGLLGAMEAGSKKLSEFLNSTAGQNKLKAWFEEGSREIREHIIPLLQSLPGFFEGLYKAGKGIADNVIPPLAKIIGFLTDMPGGIQGVVYAFATWKAISGVSSLITSLTTITNAFGPIAKGAQGMARGVGDTMLRVVDSVAYAGTGVGKNADLINGKFLDTQKSGSGLAKFSGALGALGAAGGPVLALALTALPPLIEKLNDYTTSAEQAARNTKLLHDNQEELLKTLDKTTGALTRQSRDQFIQGAGGFQSTDGNGKKLSDQNALQAANQLKIPLDVYANAGVGDPAALQQVTDILVNNNLGPEFKANPRLKESLTKLSTAGLSQQDVFDALLGKPDAVQRYVDKLEKAKNVRGFGSSPGETDLSAIFDLLSPTGKAAVTAGGALFPKTAAIPGTFGQFDLQNQAQFGAKHLTGSGQALFGAPDARIVAADDGYTVFVPNLSDEQRKQLDDAHTPAQHQPDGQWLVRLPKDTPLVYAAGGPTPADMGPLPDGGYHAVVHPEEWMLNKLGRKTVGDRFAAAANRGVLDPNLLPHFDIGGPGDGKLVDAFGNPVTPGMLPGPSTPLIDPSAPVAPNPAIGGAGQVLSSALSGLGSPISNLTSLIPGLGGGQTGGGLGGLTPGLAGLAQAGGDQNLLGAWGQQTGDYLANFGANFATKFATTLYSGVLGFFGLENSILSPSNPWFQAGAKSLGILDNFFPSGQGDGSLQLGAQSITLGDGSTISIPTFGTSGGGAGAGALNQLSKASSLGGASVTYTPELLASKGIAPLFSRTLDANGNSVAQIPDWANTLAGAFGLTATSHSDSTLHGNKTGGWAFDFSGKPEDEQKFADFIQSNLSGQTLQAIWQNPGTGQQLGIAGGQLLGRDQYYTGKGGSYADHTDHVHWATDVAPNLWDSNGKSLIPGVPDIAGGKQGAAGFAQPGGLPFSLPAGISGGGRGAGLNLALAAQRGARRGGDPASNKALARAIFAEYFPASEWSAFDTLEVHEAGYNNTAKNPSSTAYGMGQFLDSTWAGYGSKTSDPETQIRYMLAYIKDRYGTPSAAWAQYYNHPGGVGWYDNGGWLQPGLSMMLNQTGKPEAVLNPAQTQAYQTVASHLEKQGAAIQPSVPQLPDVRKLAPRGSAVIPSAPTTPLPAPVSPAPVAPPPAAPADQQPAEAPYAGPTPVAPVSGDGNHNLAAINTGIASTAATLGNIASTAASAASFGAGAGGGGAGALISGLFNEGGKIATDLVNVGSSFLVGNVTTGTTPNAYGELAIGAQNVPQTAADNRTTYNVQAGYRPAELMEAIRLKEAQDMQARLAQFA